MRGRSAQPRKKEKVKTILKEGISKKKNFSELREEIIKFKNNGGNQNEAQRILEELRNDNIENEETEDIILDLLDHVTGWCQEKFRIWKDDWKKLAEEYDNKDWSFSSTYVWQKISEENPTNFNLVQYSDQLRLSGNYLKAQEIIDNVKVENIPKEDRFLYHTQKGMIHKDKGELDKAIACFRKSVELQPNETYPYIFLATSLSKKSKLNEAQNILQEALKKEGDIDEVNYNLSLIFARKGNFEKAIKLMEDCLNIDPEYSNAKKWLEDFKNMKRKLNNK